MTLTRRLGVGYAWVSVCCLLLVVWLGYQEFIKEPADFAARGVGDVHKDTIAELSTVCFLAIVPILLGIGWWWTCRVLAPLQALTNAVENLHRHNLRQPLPRSRKGDEVDKLSAVFNSMAVRLDESFHRMQEFTLHASHELKTPLTVMRAHLETALRENESVPAEQSKWIDDQIDEVKRLTRIVDSLTLLSKADSGLIELDREPVQFGELVQEAFENALALAHPFAIQVTLGKCDELVGIGDRHRLRQLLLILTDNAVKYNRPGGNIVISLRKIAESPEVRITNTGEGIAPETLDRIFGRFVRGKNARGKADGCGLGLTIAQWIVHAHGGSIQLLTEDLDKTTAVVRFPRINAINGANAAAVADGKRMLQM